MSVHTKIDKEGIYFITFTCHDWLPLIQVTNGYDMIYKWYDILSSNSHVINGYVIMPNHLHMLLYYTGVGPSLNRIVGNGKRFMAYSIIEALEAQKEKRLLNRLNLAVTPSGKKRGKKHEVWKDSFDVKECRTEPFVLQKLNYIHNNPCAGKWKLADSPVHYWHSSASFYISGRHAGYPVKDYRIFLYPDT